MCPAFLPARGGPARRARAKGGSRIVRRGRPLRATKRYCGALFAAARRYLRRVASPPRRWRSARFLLRTRRTARHAARSTPLSRSVTSLCTVDLLTPKCAAQARTVQPVSRMYRAQASAPPLHIFPHKTSPCRPSATVHFMSKNAKLERPFRALLRPRRALRRAIFCGLRRRQTFFPPLAAKSLVNGAANLYNRAVTTRKNFPQKKERHVLAAARTHLPRLYQPRPARLSARVGLARHARRAGRARFVHGHRDDGHLRLHHPLQPALRPPDARLRHARRDPSSACF